MFSYRTGDKLEADPDGTELPDLDTALAEAVDLARELLRQLSDLGPGTVIDIADGTGAIVRTVPFAAAVRSS